MKDDITNLKEIIDSVLKDVHTTSQLKANTIKNCKSSNKRFMRPIIATAVSAAIVIMGITRYEYFSHSLVNPSSKTKQIIDNSNTKNSESALKNTNESIDNSPNSTAHQSTKQDVAYNNNKSSNNTNISRKSNSNNSETKVSQNSQAINTNNTSNNSNVAIIPNQDINVHDTAQDTHLPQQVDQNKSEKSEAQTSASSQDSVDAAKKSYNSSQPTNVPMAALTTSPSTAEAEKYWGEKLVLPSFIPSGFELTDIFIPKDSSKEKYLKLTYSSKNSYFRILENKSTTYSNIGKVIYINGIPAYVTESKDESNPDSTIIQIIWSKNNIQYSITGNISEDIMVNIIKSIT